MSSVCKIAEFQETPDLRQFRHFAHASQGGSFWWEEDAIDDVDNSASGHVVCARDASRVDAVILQKKTSTLAAEAVTELLRQNLATDV